MLDIYNADVRQLAEEYYSYSVDGSSTYTNAVDNGDFSQWTGGDTGVPDCWTLLWGLTCKETENSHGDASCLKLSTTLSEHGALFIGIDSDLGIGHWRNKNIVFGGWVQTVHPDTYIYVADGMHTTTVLIPADGSWHWISENHTVASNAVYLRLFCYINVGTEPMDAYFADIYCVEGTSMVQTIMPIDAIRDDLVNKQYSIDAMGLGITEATTSRLTVCDRCGIAYPRKGTSTTSRELLIRVDNLELCSDCIDEDPDQPEV